MTPVDLIWRPSREHSITRLRYICLGLEATSLNGTSVCQRPFESGKPTAETVIRPQIQHHFAQGGKEGIAVQPTKGERLKPKIRDVMGRVLGGNQASYGCGLLYPEKSQGETKVRAPQAP